MIPDERHLGLSSLEPALTVLEGALYFAGSSIDSGDEPWDLNSVAGGPVQLADIRSSSA